MSILSIHLTLHINLLRIDLDPCSRSRNRRIESLDISQLEFVRSPCIPIAASVVFFEVRARGLFPWTTLEAVSKHVSGSSELEVVLVGVEGELCSETIRVEPALPFGCLLRIC